MLNVFHSCVVPKRFVKQNIFAAVFHTPNINGDGRCRFDVAVGTDMVCFSHKNFIVYDLRSLEI